MKLRKKLAYSFLWLSGIFKGLSYLLLRPKTVIIESLTLPNWFIVHEHIIK